VLWLEQYIRVKVKLSLCFF